MSALGQKQTCAVQEAMSALLPKADMCGATGDLSFGPIADIGSPLLCRFPIATKEITDSRTRPYREQHACQYGQPQFPTVKLRAEPQYED
jgi:hypothetical protein